MLWVPLWQCWVWGVVCSLKSALFPLSVLLPFLVSIAGYSRDMYSLTGDSLATTTKLGPWAKAFSCTSVRGVLERLWTHLTLLWLADATDVASDVVVAASGLTSDVTSKISSSELTSVPVLEQ